MKGITFKPDFQELRAGARAEGFLLSLDYCLSQTDRQVSLDLSDVVYMDTTGFREVFNRLPHLYRVVPPRDPHTIERYNEWLDSKKGLSKNYL